MKLKSLKQFNRMKQENQIKYLQKIAKTANTRLKKLQNHNIKNSATDIVNTFSSKAVKNNTFYTGKKYNDNEIINSFNHINAFLQNEESTIKGYKSRIKREVKQAIKDNSINMNTMRFTNDYELKIINDELSKVTNKKMKVLREHGETKNAYAKAEQFLISSNANNLEFQKSNNIKSKNYIKLNIQQMLKFNQSQTSTIEGIKHLKERRLQKFRDIGINIETKDADKFWDFLSSKQFKNLKSKADSNQVINDFVYALNEDLERDTINEEWQQFLDKNITYDVVRDRLEDAVKNKKLMH